MIIQTPSSIINQIVSDRIKSKSPIQIASAHHIDSSPKLVKSTNSAFNTLVEEKQVTNESSKSPNTKRSPDLLDLLADSASKSSSDTSTVSSTQPKIRSSESITSTISNSATNTPLSQTSSNSTISNTSTLASTARNNNIGMQFLSPNPLITSPLSTWTSTNPNASLIFASTANAPYFPSNTLFTPSASAPSLQGVYEDESIKRKISPVETVGEMLDRIDEYNRVRLTVKSKNKACEKIGYSKGTINAYRERVKEAESAGIDLNYYRDTKYRDFKRLLTNPMSCVRNTLPTQPTQEQINARVNASISEELDAIGTKQKMNAKRKSLQNSNSHNNNNSSGNSSHSVSTEDDEEESVPQTKKQAVISHNLNNLKAVQKPTPSILPHPSAIVPSNTLNNTIITPQQQQQQFLIANLHHQQQQQQQAAAAAFQAQMQAQQQYNQYAAVAAAMSMNNQFNPYLTSPPSINIYSHPFLASQTAPNPYTLATISPNVTGYQPLTASRFM